MGNLKKDSLGDRMKGAYEDPFRIHLSRRVPMIIRLDGKAFHSYTKSFEKPFDVTLMKAFKASAEFLLNEISGAKIAYTQSDELSILVTDYDEFSTQSWFDKNLQKVVSVASSLITAKFNQFMLENTKIKSLAFFDARAFLVPKEEVNNYFLWRQNDASRNSISSLAQSKFSHKDLHKKNTSQMQDMLMEKFQINWNNLETWKKRGFCVTRVSEVGIDGTVRTKMASDKEIPIFSQDTNYINKFVYL